MERNRLILVLTAFQLRTILVLLPVLFASELGMTTLAVRQGWFRDKVAGWRWSLSRRKWLRAHRRETQALRQVPDRELAHYLTPIIDPQMIDLPSILRVANPLMRLTGRSLGGFSERTCGELSRTVASARGGLPALAPSRHEARQSRRRECAEPCGGP